MIAEVPFSSNNISWVCDTDSWNVDPRLPPGLSDCGQRRVLLLLFFSRSVVSNSLLPSGLLPTRLLCPWDSPGKNAGVGCHFLLQNESQCNPDGTRTCNP